MNPNKMLWEKGDFTKLAENMRDSGSALVATLGVKASMRILDLGCGDGTTAIPEARLGATVLGVDIAQNLVAAGNRRAQAEGLSNCHFQEGDACSLDGIEDASFDMVVSIFGAMFAPKPYDVAKEMVRVTKPGGKIIMGNWIPGDPTLVAQILRISASYMPPPPEGFISPMLWGKPDEVTNRFAQAGIPASNLSFSTEQFMFHTPFPSNEFVRIFKEFYGPTMNAFDAAAANGKEAELQQELETLFANQNQAPDAGTTHIPANFLKVTVMR